MFDIYKCIHVDFFYMTKYWYDIRYLYCDVCVHIYMHSRLCVGYMVPKYIHLCCFYLQGQLGTSDLH